MKACSVTALPRRHGQAKILLHAVSFDPSIGTARLCVYIRCFLSHSYAVTFQSSAVTFSPPLSLIFSSLSRCITRGINPRLPWQRKPPMQVYAFTPTLPPASTFGVPAARRPHPPRPPPVTLLSCTATCSRSGFDSCLSRDALTCHTRIPPSNCLFCLFPVKDT